MAFSKFSPTPDLTQHGEKPASRPDFGFARQASRTRFLRAEDVLAATDIVELIGEVVELRPRGKEFLGLCPFHNDSSPSFEVNGAKGIYSCWSCNAGMNGSRGGNAITFVRRYHGMDFKEALNFLAHRAGMSVPHGERIGIPKTNPKPDFIPRTPSPSSVPERKEPNKNAPKEPLYKMMESAQHLFSSELAQNPAIVKYLTQDRGIDPALLGKYRIGYAPDSFDRFKSKVSDYDTNEALFDSGLIKESARGRRYDFFRDRLMFGVRDDQGRIVAFGGRRVGEETKKDAKGNDIPVAKYLNSPETAIFNKSDILFGWYEAKEDIAREGSVLMVEGYMDVLGLASQGVTNAAACMGTALTERHVETILSRVKQIVFCFDGDKAGQLAGFRSLQAVFPHLENDVTVRFLSLPDNLDPDEFIRKHGKAQFLKAIDESNSLPVFWERALLQLYPNDKDKKQLWENAKDLVNLLPDSSSLKEQLLHIAGRLSGVSPKKSPPRPSFRSNAATGRATSSGMRSFVANEPSDRLYLAIHKMPELAAEVRPQLIRMQSSISGELISDLAQWQGKFDQAMAAGLSRSIEERGLISGPEQRQYEAIIRAAPSILSQYLAIKEREALSRALEDGEVDEVNYLSKLRSSSFSRPR